MNTETVSAPTIPDTVASLQPPRPQTSLTPPPQGFVPEVTMRRYGIQIPPDAQMLYDAINSCGSSQEVADLLRSHGARGDRGVLGTCPISNFAAACVPSALSIETDQDGITLHLDSDLIHLLHIDSVHVTEFVKNFDSGLYPDLVE